jgi:hypothetical protein
MRFFSNLWDDIFGDDDKVFKEVRREIDKVSEKVQVNMVNGNVSIKIKGKIKTISINGHKLEVKPKMQGK